LLSDENSEIKSRYDSIVQEIGKENKLLIIKVDDLDRLSTNEIIDTLRLIRIIANFPNTVYLVGYDKNYINSAIEQGLTKHNPEKYIDKVFTLGFVTIIKGAPEALTILTIVRALIEIQTIIISVVHGNFDSMFLASIAFLIVEAVIVKTLVGVIKKEEEEG
jgi:predicted KAP-like P-loop ATPase